MVKYGLISGFFMLLATPSIACGVLEKAQPKVGSIVASTDHIVLTFTEAIVPGFSNVYVTGANAAIVATSTPISSNHDTMLTLQTSQPLEPGIYKVIWNARWLDCGSTSTGDYQFTVQ